MECPNEELQITVLLSEALEKLRLARKIEFPLGSMSDASVMEYALDKWNNQLSEEAR